MCEYNGNLWANLMESFKEDAMSLMLLLCVTATYPLLAELGFVILAPIWIVVENEITLLQIAEVLAGFSKPMVLPVSAKPKELECFMKSASNYGTMMFRFVTGRYTNQNLDTILADCQSFGRPIHEKSMKIIVSLGQVPAEYKDSMAGVVFIRENSKAGSINKGLVEAFLHKWITFCLGHIPEIKNIVKENTWDEGVFHLEVAGDMMKMYLKTIDMPKEKRLEFEEAIEEALCRIHAECQMAESPETYEKLFKKILYNSYELFLKVLDREHLDGSDIPDIEDSLIYDAKFYFMSNNIFTKLCTQLSEEVSCSYIKQQLVEAKVLLCKGTSRNYFTQQTEIITAYGGIIRKRFLKMDRQKIDIVGEAPLKDYLQMMKGEEDIGRDEARQNEYHDWQRTLGEIGGGF